MPFQRRYRRKPRFRRRRRFTRRRPMTARRVRRIVDAELKVNDLGLGPIEIPSATGQMNSMSNIDLGDTSSLRNGNWITPVSFMGTITVIGNELDIVNTTVTYRVGCLQWLENQTLSNASIDKIMADTTAPHQGYNITNKGQFKILWSRTGILSTDVTNPRFQAVHKFYVKPRLKVLYDGGSGRNNQLFIFGYSEVATGSNPPSYAFDSRLRYTDS